MHNTTHVLLCPALTNPLEFHGLAFSPAGDGSGVGLQARVRADGWAEIIFSEPWVGTVNPSTVGRLLGIKVFPGVPLHNLPPEYARFVWNQAAAQGWQRERGSAD